MPVDNNFCLPMPRAVIEDSRAYNAKLIAQPFAAVSAAATKRTQHHRHHARPARPQASPTAAASPKAPTTTKRAVAGGRCDVARGVVCDGGANCERNFCVCPAGTRNDGQRCAPATLLQQRQRRPPIAAPPRVQVAAIRRAPWHRPPLESAAASSPSPLVGYRLPFENCGNGAEEACAAGAVCVAQVAIWLALVARRTFVGEPRPHLRLRSSTSSVPWHVSRAIGR